jgi:hypothetical protein
MNKLRVFLLGIVAITWVLSAPVIVADDGNSSIQIENDSDGSNSTIERTLISRGTQYNLTINTSNHTVLVNARHFGKNKTAAGYVVALNGNSIISTNWYASHGETHNSNSSLIYEYNALKQVQNITLSTYGGSTRLSYNFTVPRKHEGRYLRPTVTDVSFERINRTSGRVTVTVRSDSQYRYPAYIRVWAPGVKADVLYLHAGADKNVSTDSLIVPVSQDEPFEGELRMHANGLNKQGPISAEWEFYGYPGDAHFTRVPYEPMRLERVTEYTYVNESSSAEGAMAGVSEGLFRRALGTAGVVLALIVVLGVVLGRRRRV